MSEKRLKFVPEVISVESIHDQEFIQLFLHLADQGGGSYVGISYRRTEEDPDLLNLFCFDSAEMVDEFADKIKELLTINKYE